jgi:hypothetical protein
MRSLPLSEIGVRGNPVNSGIDALRSSGSYSIGSALVRPLQLGGGRRSPARARLAGACHVFTAAGPAAPLWSWSVVAVSVRTCSTHS